MKEALRYLNNARAILRTAPRKDGTYTDVKPVREACGTAYLAVLKAIDESLLARGVGRKDLPKSVEGYRVMLHTHFLAKNGKLFREFEMLYDALHIAGYYRGLLYGVDMVRDAMKATEHFINSISA